MLIIVSRKNIVVPKTIWDMGFWEFEEPRLRVFQDNKMVLLERRLLSLSGINFKVSPFYDQSTKMIRLYDSWNENLKIQKFRRTVGYTIFFSFSALISYAYNSNTTRAGFSRGDQFYASYPAGSELLTDTTKLYKSALGNCFEVEEWGPIEWSMMAKHFERQGKSPYAYHAQYQAHLASNGNLDGSG
ncbi:hypothetical protein L1887_15606 [Cichorium endivia]|nr:hypothetical protein L1887_15606 [Cichorium endivia]